MLTIFSKVSHLMERVHHCHLHPSGPPQDVQHPQPHPHPPLLDPQAHLLLLHWRLPRDHPSFKHDDSLGRRPTQSGRVLCEETKNRTKKNPIWGDSEGVLIKKRWRDGEIQERPTKKNARRGRGWYHGALWRPTLNLISTDSNSLFSNCNLWKFKLSISSLSTSASVSSSS